MYFLRKILIFLFCRESSIFFVFGIFGFLTENSTSVILAGKLSFTVLAKKTQFCGKTGFLHFWRKTRFCIFGKKTQFSVFTENSIFFYFDDKLKFCDFRGNTQFFSVLWKNLILITNKLEEIIISHLSFSNLMLRT